MTYRQRGRAIRSATQRISLRDLRQYVIRRDRRCVAAKLDLTHVCRDKWGNETSPDDWGALTLEHVKDRMGTRHDDPLWCVASCHHANVIERHESANRSDYWAYLEGVRAAVGMA